jgi:hypothetical protein
LINRLTGKCIDVHLKSTDDVSLQQFTCNLGGNQRWALASLVPQELPLTLDEFFSVAQWEANDAAPVSIRASTASDACAGSRAPDARGACHVIELDSFPDGTSYANAHWLYPRASWGTLPGLLVQSGATRIRFQLRGESGGEKVVFKAGDVQGSAFEDSFSVAPVELVLATSWQAFELDLAGADYSSGIVRGLSWTTNHADNTAPLKFYVDDIVLE